MARPGIYVEIPIRACMEELWDKTQNPQLHQRWDLRFSQIEYLPRPADGPQRFLYRTRIGVGLKIDGRGESTGTRDGEKGERTSSLKFWSDDRKSLIETGSGYWKYVPVSTEYLQSDDADSRSTIRFFTWYDYQTRFGVLGRLIDQFCFRPLLGWATAWSFDRLRLWIEKGIPPETSRDRAMVYTLARGATTFIWLYHGLVPKLLYHDRIELDLMSRITPVAWVRTGTTFAGVLELGFAFLLILLWRQSWLLWVTMVLMLAGIPIVACTSPEYLHAAFNPVTLNISLAAFAAIALVARRDLASAAHCLRKPQENS